ncbi:TraY domain-containing protein [Klebsiella pneumoniae]|nr:TraY domain-containing protein [Klebsiella pneumoniae]
MKLVSILTLAIRRSGRVKGTEVQLRVDDHLRKFPDFYDVQKFTVLKKTRKRLFLFGLMRIQTKC